MVGGRNVIFVISQEESGYEVAKRILMKRRDICRPAIVWDR